MGKGQGGQEGGLIASNVLLWTSVMRSDGRAKLRLWRGLASPGPRDFEVRTNYATPALRSSLISALGSPDRELQRHAQTVDEPNTGAQHEIGIIR